MEILWFIRFGETKIVTRNIYYSYSPGEPAEEKMLADVKASFEI